ncbi:GNAT family N-acetyltransferase [Actinoallomurus acaciae]|uniref:GNAT family N-acetyltransferase n=1 Tax=Actinoallomurus acaciae TaxID=502577 RepID=A0ABV5YT67_9ACTN
MKVEHVTSMAEVPADSAIFAGSHLYNGHAWLSFCERHDYSRPHHLVGRDDQGRILGMLPAYEISKEGHPRYRPGEALAGTLPESAHPDSRWFPGLVLGARTGNRNGLLDGDGPAAERTRVLGGLLDEALALAREQERRALWYLYLDVAEASRLRAAWPRAVPHFIDFELVIPVPESYEAYLAGLNKLQRRNVGRERKAFAESSPELVRVPYDEDICPVIAPLLAKLQAKHGMPRTVEWLTERLRRQAVAMAGAGEVILLRRDGRLVAFVLMLGHRSGLYCISVGIDYELAARNDYFNITYYEPLNVALEKGATSMYVGMGTAEAKLRRGAVPVPLWGLTEMLDPAADIRRDEVDHRNRLRLAEAREWCAARVQRPIDDLLWQLPDAGAPDAGT